MEQTRDERSGTVKLETPVVKMQRRPKNMQSQRKASREEWRVKSEEGGGVRVKER